MRTKAQIHCLSGHTNTVAEVRCQAAEPQVYLCVHLTDGCVFLVIFIYSICLFLLYCTAMYTTVMQGNVFSLVALIKIVGNY